MTRNDVLKLFPEATDDQITNLLNQNSSEVAEEKTKQASTRLRLIRQTTYRNSLTSYKLAT